MSIISPPTKAICVRAMRRTIRSEEPRLNSSHTVISYAVFCLKKKKNTQIAGIDMTESNGIGNYQTVMATLAQTYGELDFSVNYSLSETRDAIGARQQITDSLTA